MKLKFSGLSNFIYWNRCTKFQQNLRVPPGDPLLSWHGMTQYRYCHLILENIWAQYLSYCCSCFYFYFYFVIEKHRKFFCQKESLLTYFTYLLFIPMSQKIDVINRSSTCYFFTCIRLVVQVLACAHVITQIKWIRLFLKSINLLTT